MLMQGYHQALIKRSHKITPLRHNVKLIVYQGSSMSSIFHDMDVLYYIPNKKVKAGDVVVIKISESKQKVIHRIISTGKKGIRTMGDCNPYPDNWLLSPDKILGTVAYGYRGRRRFSVSSGLAGLARMYKERLKRLIIKTTYPVLSSLYHNFHIYSLVILLIRPKKVAFKKTDGTELHLLSRGRVIGRRLPGQKWQIKLPYRYLLDENSLSN